jgi:hypothetical protein
MFKTSLWVFLTALLLLSLPFRAAARCPGNVASVHARRVAGALLVVPVEMDHTGPYDFMVDTGSQVTLIDPALSATLHLKEEGSAMVIGVRARSSVPFVHVAQLEVGPHAVSGLSALVQDLGNLQAFDRRIRGVLGSDFLSHFDVLLDLEGQQLCLDDSEAMQRAVRGQRIPFVHLPEKGHEGYTTAPSVVSVHLTGVLARQFNLLIDSGAISPYLTHDAVSFFGLSGRRQRSDVVNARADLNLLLPLNLDVGRITLREVTFVVPSENAQPRLQVDGLLPTALFHRVLICYANHFAVLEP